MFKGDRINITMREISLKNDKRFALEKQIISDEAKVFNKKKSFSMNLN